MWEEDYTHKSLPKCKLKSQLSTTSDAGRNKWGKLKHYSKRSAQKGTAGYILALECPVQKYWESTLRRYTNPSQAVQYFSDLVLTSLQKLNILKNWAKHVRGCKLQNRRGELRVKTSAHRAGQFPKATFGRHTKRMEFSLSSQPFSHPKGPLTHACIIEHARKHQHDVVGPVFSV